MPHSVMHPLIKTAGTRRINIDCAQRMNIQRVIGAALLPARLHSNERAFRRH